MKKLLSREEVESCLLKFDIQRREKLGFLVNFGWLEHMNPDELYDKEVVKKYKKFFLKKLKDIKTKLNIKEDWTDLTLEEKILNVIAITKALNVDLLIERLGDKLTEPLAEQFVEYGYTHGSCNSLMYTICTLFPECESKLFKNKGYGHQCAMLDGKCYDITGCSTLQEMKDFVAKESKTPEAETTVENVSLSKGSFKTIDYVVCVLVGKVFHIGKHNNLTI